MALGGASGRKLRERKEEPREERAPPPVMLLISGTEGAPIMRYEK